jgi:haloacetate dehalogenase
MIDGFEYGTQSIHNAVIRYARHGDGPPLLLLHGYPQTHHAWRLVAPKLAKRFTVIVPDLPGYGESKGPSADYAGNGYSKRNMANILLAFMAALGFDRFHVAGHDRGGRVGYRMCLDHPERVARFAPVDIVPTAEVWEAMRAEQAIGSHHWAFLAQPQPVPELMIGAAAPTYIGYLLDLWAGDPAALDTTARHTYISQFSNPSVAWATCEDYRAGATVDWQHDNEDLKAGRKIQCPVHMLWGTKYLKFEQAEVQAIWERWCAAAIGVTSLPCGHFIMEEEPAACAAALLSFFSGEA